MTDRPKLKVRDNPSRDPERRPVRAATAPRPSQARAAGAAEALKASPGQATYPPREREREPDDRGAPPRSPRPPPAPARTSAPQRTPQRPAPQRPAPPRKTPQRDKPQRETVQRDTRQRETPRREAQPRQRPVQEAPTRQAPADDGIRLSKRMTELKLASRREADEWIEAGWVTVDGQVAVLGQRVQPGVKIAVDPVARQQQAERVTILLHKPIGLVSGQPEDGYEAAVSLIKRDTHWADDPTRKPFHHGHLRQLAPAGRLDIDSTGLLVLTQDGRVARQLIGEDSNIEKEYLVRVERTAPGPLPEHSLELLRHGLWLDGKPLKPAKVSWANEDQLRFVLREGRKRQIRRMCEEVGLKVMGLKRVRIGSITLGRLPLGQWRFLGPHERFG